MNRKDNRACRPAGTPLLRPPISNGASSHVA